MVLIQFHSLLLFLDSGFASYLSLGWNHIIDITAYDHLLFVMTLCAAFKVEEWRKILVIVTAFTIGHSITLALSVLDLIPVNKRLIEGLIPLTIMFTAVSNLIPVKGREENKTFGKKVRIKYLFALGFGLIHGMAFANSFKWMLGTSHGVVKELFAFNCGLEVGQICIVLTFMGALFLLTRIFHLLHRDWTLFISGAGFGISLTLFINVLLVSR
jgi:hypothetical protein